MNVFFVKNTLSRQKKFFSLYLVLLLLPLFLLAGCRKPVCYLDYVSELRSNLFFAETEELSLRIYAVEKETPYAADGIPQEVSPRFEAYLVAPSGTQNAQLHFQIEERTFGGEMSYDNVKGEYFYSCTLDVSRLSAIDCTVKYGEREVSITAKSAKTAATLSPQAVLDILVKENAELFDSLTDKYGFAGEIYLRLIYEDSPYYYAGVMDREGKVYAFLLNAESGKILARRES